MNEALDLVTAMNNLAQSLQKVLVCWQEKDETDNHFRMFDCPNEAETFFEQTLKVASHHNYKFYAY